MREETTVEWEVINVGFGEQALIERFRKPERPPEVLVERLLYGIEPDSRKGREHIYALKKKMIKRHEKNSVIGWLYRL